MQDLTDTKRQAETVTIEAVYQLGMKNGTEAERNAVLNLLSGMALGNEELEDFVFQIKAVVKAGGHRAPRA